MSEHVRWGIAGPGWIGEQMVEALRTLDDADVVAVGSRVLDRATAFADRHRIPHAHGSYAALVSDPEVDVVYVAGPHPTHRDLTLMALEAGKHVVCEKPLAMDAAEGREVVAAARSAGRFLMEAMWMWFLPSIIEVRRRLGAGEIGKVRAVRADFALSATDPAGRHLDPTLGGGALLDLGIYVVSLGRLLLGPPTAIVALGDIGPTGVDTNVGAILSHADGALTIGYTGLDGPSGLGAEIVGTEGLIRLAPPFWATSGIEIRRLDGTRERIDLPHGGLAHEAAHAMERIRAGATESDVIPLEESVAVLETLDEIQRQVRDSHATRPR